MRALPVLDPRRMTYMEVAAKEEGACIRAIFETWPTPSKRMLPDQWIAGACIYFGLPIPMLSTFVGATIGNSQKRCDAHGHVLMAAHVGGDGWKYKHDAISWCVDDIASAMHVRSTVEVYNLFSRHMSLTARQFLWQPSRSNQVRQGYIPDILVHLNPAVLGEFKGITPCKSWYSRRAPNEVQDDFGYAGNHRQSEISKDYIARARAIDQRYHSTPAGTVGPFEEALRAHGGHGVNDRLTGLVFGAFGGISSNFASLLRSLVKAGALKLYPRMASASMRHCESTLLWQARRTLGHTLWTEGADLVLHRIQYLGGPASRGRSRQRHAQFRLFPAGGPAAATHAHRMVANGFDIGSDYRRFRR